MSVEGTTKRVFLVAGEPSGDQLGAGLIRSLKKELGNQTIFCGVGGEQMCSQGLESIFPMSDLSVMGLVEVLPQIFLLNKRLNQTVQTVQRLQPDILVTIDSPGFTFRLAKKLKKLNCPKIHYVAPTVWAWKPSRAKKISKFYDHLLVLLPFEPQYFNHGDMLCTFVGHPMAKETPMSLGVQFRKDHGLEGKTVLGVFPGSRKSEILRMLPVFKEVVEKLSVNNPNLEIVITTIPHVKSLVKLCTQSWQLNVTIVDSFMERKAAHQACDIAIAASGTITTELSAARVPVVVGYKVSPITAFIARRLLRVSSVSLVNIVAGKRIIPEFLQTECNPNNLFNAVSELLENSSVREQQILEQIGALKELDGGPEGSFSKASQIIRDTLYCGIDNFS